MFAVQEVHVADPVYPVAHEEQVEESEQVLQWAMQAPQTIGGPTLVW